MPREAAPGRLIQGACGVAARSACADPGRGAHSPGFAPTICPVKSRVFGVMTVTGHAGAAAKKWAARFRGASTSSRWWLVTLLEIVLSCFDLLVRELQSDFTSSGTLCRGWLYLPEV
jgi:hypothetical protein